MPFALIEAAKHGRLLEVKELIREGASVNARDTNLDGTPLFWASCGGSELSVQELIGAGSEVNALNAHGHTALHAAADRGYGKVVRTLLNSGAAVNAKNCEGLTPLHLAAYRGYAGVVHLLLSSGADLHSRSNDNKTALHEALAQRHFAVVETLSYFDPSPAAAALHHNMQCSGCGAESKNLPRHKPSIGKSHQVAAATCTSASQEKAPELHLKKALSSPPIAVQGSKSPDAWRAEDEGITTFWGGRVDTVPDPITSEHNGSWSGRAAFLRHDPLTARGRCATEADWYGRAEEAFAVGPPTLVDAGSSVVWRRAAYTSAHRKYLSSDNRGEGYARSYYDQASVFPSQTSDEALAVQLPQASITDGVHVSATFTTSGARGRFANGHKSASLDADLVAGQDRLTTLSAVERSRLPASLGWTLCRDAATRETESDSGYDDVSRSPCAMSSCSSTNSSCPFTRNQSEETQSGLPQTPSAFWSHSEKTPQRPAESESTLPFAGALRTSLLKGSLRGRRALSADQPEVIASALLATHLSKPENLSPALSGLAAAQLAAPSDWAGMTAPWTLGTDYKLVDIKPFSVVSGESSESKLLFRIMTRSSVTCTLKVQLGENDEKLNGASVCSAAFSLRQPSTSFDLASSFDGRACRTTGQRSQQAEFNRLTMSLSHPHLARTVACFRGDGSFCMHYVHDISAAVATKRATLPKIWPPRLLVASAAIAERRGLLRQLSGGSMLPVTATFSVMADDYRHTLGSYVRLCRAVQPDPPHGLDPGLLIRIVYETLCAAVHLRGSDLWLCHCAITPEAVYLKHDLHVAVGDVEACTPLRAADSAPLVCTEEGVLSSCSHASDDTTTWPPELERYVLLHSNGTLAGETVYAHDLYKKADTYVIGRMMYAVLAAVSGDDEAFFPVISRARLHYADNEVPALLPMATSRGDSGYPPILCSLLASMVRDVSTRPSAADALCRAAYELSAQSIATIQDRPTEPTEQWVRAHLQDGNEWPDST